MTRACTGLALAAAGAFVLCGCASVTGLGGSSSYACQAPEGVTCNSVSGVYANALRDNLPAQRAATPRAPGAPAEVALATRRTPGSLDAGQIESLRAPPRVLRLWLKAWEDADHDLHDQGYVYVQVDSGRWRVDHMQRRDRQGFAPIRPPSRAESAPTSVGGDGDARTPSDAPQRPRPASSPLPPARSD